MSTPVAHALDIPATILELLGAPVPPHGDGKPLPVTADQRAMAAAG